MTSYDGMIEKYITTLKHLKHLVSGHFRLHILLICVFPDTYFMNIRHVSG